MLREWSRLKAYVTRTPSLCKLKYAELYARLFDHSSEKSNPLHYHNVLLLVAIVMCMAIDTSICERGFSLMNLLKTASKTAKRSTMGNELLRILGFPRNSRRTLTIF